MTAERHATGPSESGRVESPSESGRVEPSSERGRVEPSSERDRVEPSSVGGRVEELFLESGALREGHFQLKSGRHAERYLEKFQVLQYPEAVSELCGYLAALLDEPEGRAVDVVVGPTTGGVILAFEVARQLGVRGIFAEEVRDPDGTTRREFRRGFALGHGERVLLVDDILTTGGSLLAMLPPIEAAGADLVLAAVLVDRSGGLTTVTSPVSGASYPAKALWTLDLPTYDPGPDTCPGCRAAIPLEIPGSTGTRKGGQVAPIVEGTGVSGVGMPAAAPPDAQHGTPPTSLGPAT